MAYDEVSGTFSDGGGNLGAAQLNHRFGLTLSATGDASLTNVLATGRSRARTAADRAADWVHVRDYAGTAETALNAAGNAAGILGMARLPAGTYPLTTDSAFTTWVVDASTVLTGSGHLSGRVIQWAGAGSRARGTYIGHPRRWTEAYPQQFAELHSVATFGGIGVAGASRTSDVPPTVNGSGVIVADADGPAQTIGVMGQVYNDWASSAARRYAYAGYFEARRYAGGSITHGVEIDTINLVNDALDIGPYSVGVPDGATMALWLASGGAIGTATPYDSSIALGVWNNAARFRKGVVFKSDALTPAVSARGNMLAVELPGGADIQWTSATNTLAGAIGATPGGDLVLAAGASGRIDLRTVVATSATAGTRTLPGAPSGFLSVLANGSPALIPYYNP